MKLKATLAKLAAIVAEEAARNPEFQNRLEAVLTPTVASPTKAPTTSVSRRKKQEGAANPDDPLKRRGGRRAPAVIDPIDLAAHGELGLRERLASLDLERLHDIVAQYGMDPGKLVMKWRDSERVIERIVEVALARATKGDAFRKD